MGLLLLAGCWPPVMPDDPRAERAGAIVAVVADVYQKEGQGRVIFLRSLDESFDESALAGVMAALASELGVRVLPYEQADRSIRPSLPPLTPVDPDTGDVGIIITLSDIASEDMGIQMRVGFARSGLDGKVFLYTLQQNSGLWTIADIVLQGIG